MAVEISVRIPDLEDVFTYNILSAVARNDNIHLVLRGIHTEDAPIKTREKAFWVFAVADYEYIVKTIDAITAGVIVNTNIEFRWINYTNDHQDEHMCFNLVSIKGMSNGGIALIVTWIGNFENEDDVNAKLQYYCSPEYFAKPDAAMEDAIATQQQMEILRYNLAKKFGFQYEGTVISEHEGAMVVNRRDILRPYLRITDRREFNGITYEILRSSPPPYPDTAFYLEIASDRVRRFKQVLHMPFALPDTNDQ